MNFLHWEISFRIRKRRTNRPLPEKYKKAQAEGKLYVLPAQSFTPEEYLVNLKDQLKEDIFPLLRTSGGAPFAVVRNVFCYIDHISQLLYGTGPGQSYRMKKVVNELGKTDAHINSNYKKYAKYLIQIFRHDLVHNVRPFPKEILAKSGNDVKAVETWFFMVTNHEVGMSFEDSLSLMMTRAGRRGRSHLRLAGYQVFLDTKSLLFDVVIFLDELISECQQEVFREKVASNYYKIMSDYYYSIENFKIDMDSARGVIILGPNTRLNS